jgi:hypothetical protein
MSDLVHLQVKENASTRRAVLRAIALAAVAAGLNEADAQHVHSMAGDAKAANKGVYVPKGLNADEYKTLQRLSELIMPADDRGPTSGKDAGAPEFIDLLCSQSEDMKRIYTGGFLWLDTTMQDRVGKNFVDATEPEQIAMLDRIAYRKNAAEEPTLGPGIRFFEWIRKMVVDAYFTSPAGYKDIGYKGNVGMPVFKVPQEAMDYALRRSPV